VGATSIRLPGESWEGLERRLRTMRPSDFGPAARVADTSLVSLDPGARPAFERLIAAAREAGFPVRVAETFRSPERQAYLTAGHAVDLVVGDGNLRLGRAEESEPPALELAAVLGLASRRAGRPPPRLPLGGGVAAGGAHRLPIASGGAYIGPMTFEEAGQHLSLALEAAVGRYASMVRQVGRRPAGRGRSGRGDAGGQDPALAGPGLE
jgi:hypothetical protein